jgi:O-antigen ligase
MHSIPQGHIKWYWSIALLSLICMGVSFAMQSVYPAAVPFVALLGYLLLHNIQWLYGLLIIAIPISVNLKEFSGPSIDVPDEALMLLLTVLFPFVFVINKKYFFNARLLSNRLLSLILYYFMWMIVCTIGSSDVILSTKFTLAKLWYIVPFVLYTALFIYHKPQYAFTMYKLFMASLIPMVLFITLRHKAYNFYFDRVNDATAPYFTNHVLYGSVVAILAMATVIAMLYSKGFTKQWWLLACTLVILFTAVYFSYSRGAWASIFFALGIYAALKLRLIKVAILTFYTIILSVILWLSIDNRFLNYAPRYETGIMNDNLTDHLIATLKGKDISSNERFYRWIACVRMAKENPIMGTGPNTFYEHYKAHTVRLFRTYVSANPERSTSHNYFLFMLVEQGIIGMLLYGILIVAMLHYCQLIYFSTHIASFKAIAAGVAVVTSSFFLNNFLSELVEYDKLGSLFFICMGILIGLHQHIKQHYHAPLIN